MQLSEQSTRIKLSFKDGSTSIVDNNVINYINELQKNSVNNGNLPFFKELKKTIFNYNDNFIDFYSFIIANHKLSSSKLFQDLFVYYNFQNFNHGSSLEIGTIEDGNFSNVSLLASHLGWKSIIIDENISLNEDLKNKYPCCEVLSKSLFTDQNSEISSLLDTDHNFNILDQKNLQPSTLQTSINQIFRDFFNSSPIEYLSLNLNNKNYELIKELDFDKFKPKIITVNQSSNNSKDELHEIILRSGYLRFFKEHTQYESWYVLQE